MIFLIKVKALMNEKGFKIEDQDKFYKDFVFVRTRKDAENFQFERNTVFSWMISPE